MHNFVFHVISPVEKPDNPSQGDAKSLPRSLYNPHEHYVSHEELLKKVRRDPKLIKMLK